MSNKTTEVTQFTIVCYVDDNKLSHKNPAVISNVIKEIRKLFGDLTVARGKKHTFLGTKIKIKNNITNIDMVKQLMECMPMFGKDVSTPVLSPSTTQYLKYGRIQSN